MPKLVGGRFHHRRAIDHQAGAPSSGTPRRGPRWKFALHPRSCGESSVLDTTNAFAENEKDHQGRDPDWRGARLSAHKRGSFNARKKSPRRLGLEGQTHQGFDCRSQAGELARGRTPAKVSNVFPSSPWSLTSKTFYACLKTPVGI